MDYKQAIDDFRSGVIDREKWQLVMDNDSGYWQYIGPDIGDDAQIDAEDAMTKKYGSPEGYRDIVDVLNAAGVNCDWC